MSLGDGIFKDVSANSIIIDGKLEVYGDISGGSYLYVRDASFHNNVAIADHLYVRNDVSINNKLDAIDMSFHNNVTIANDLYVGNDVSINNKLDAYDASFHHNVTIANELHVGNDVSINNKLDAYDASFHNNVTIANDLYVGNDVSINNKLDAMDASFHNNVTVENNLYVGNDVSINNKLDAYDASFHNNVNVANDLHVGNDVSINNKLDAYDASFHNNVTVANDLHVGNDVSINNKLDAYDASFHNNVTVANDLHVGNDVSINNKLDGYDASFHNDVTVSNDLHVGNDVSINNRLDAYDVSFHNNVTVANDLLVINDVSINGILSVVDMSFDNYDVNVGNDISCGGVVKAPQVFAGTGPFTELDSSYVFVGSNSNSDAVMRLEGTDGSGCEIVGSGSGDNRFGINIINDAATSKNDVLTISNDGNVGINNTSPTVKLDVGGTIAATKFSGYGITPPPQQNGYVGAIIMWWRSTTTTEIPDGWRLCDGTNGTPNLKARFVRGYKNGGETIGVTGGNQSVSLNNSLPEHTHTIEGNDTSDHTHFHAFNSINNLTHEEHKHIVRIDESTAVAAGKHRHSYDDSYGGRTDQGLTSYTDGPATQKVHGIGSADETVKKDDGKQMKPAGSHDLNFNLPTFATSEKRDEAEHEHQHVIEVLTADNSESHPEHPHNFTNVSDNVGGETNYDIRPDFYTLAYIIRYK